MNLDDLRSVQSKERQKDSLQHLRDSFYADAGEYVEELKEERDRAAERADDPFSSDEVGRLTDEIETAEEVVEAIYERRMGKLVKRASLAAAGMPSDEEGLTAEEQDLFEDLVDRIEANKSLVLDTLSGEVDTSGSDAGSAEPTDAAPDRPPADADAAPPSSDRPAGEASSVSAADLMGSGPDDDGSGSDGPDAGSQPSDSGTGSRSDGANPREPAESGGPTAGDSVAADDEGSTPPDEPADGLGPGSTDGDRTTVRITRDVGEILGVDDREYELTAEDVVTLPETNAEPLIERDAAERLD